MDYTQAREIADKSGAPKGSDLYKRIGGAVADIAAAESGIRDAAAGIRRTLDNVERMLGAAKNPIFNEFGELQSQGPMFDARIARLSGLRHELATLQAVATSVYGPSK
jgi:hypothetical protein